MKRIIEILSILLIMVTAPGCINDEVEPVWSLQAGDRLPDFEITLDDGSSVSTEMLKGRKSVIVFFISTTIRDSVLTNSERELYLCQQKESWVITSLCPMSIQRHGRVTRVQPSAIAY